MAQLVVQVMTAQAMRPRDLARLVGMKYSRIYIVLDEKRVPIRLVDAEQLLTAMGFTLQFRAIKTEGLDDERSGATDADTIAVRITGRNDDPGHAVG